MSGSAALTLAAGDVITLRNNSAMPLTMDFAHGVGAQMRIMIADANYGYEVATIGAATVVGGADVPFSNNGPLTGVTHTSDTTTFIVNVQGTYLINYDVSMTTGVGSQLAIAVNGTVDASTPITALVATGEISGSAVIDLAAGDVITLRNNSAIPLTMNLAPGAGAQMTILRLQD